MILTMQPFNCDQDIHVREVSDIVFTDDMLCYTHIYDDIKEECEGLIATTEDTFYLVSMDKSEFWSILGKLNHNTPVDLTRYLSYVLDRDDSDCPEDLYEFISMCRENQTYQSNVFN